MALARSEQARRLREAREARGLTQEEVARRVGVSLKSYNRWESTSGHEPRTARLDKLAEILGVDRDYLQGPLPSPLGLGRNGDAQQLQRIENMLIAVCAHLGISSDTIPDAPPELIAALDQPKRKTAKTRRRVKASSPST